MTYEHEAVNWLQCKISLCDKVHQSSVCLHVMMSDLLTAHFLTALSFNLSTCNSSSLSYAAKPTRQYFISLPQELQGGQVREEGLKIRSSCEIKR